MAKATPKPDHDAIRAMMMERCGRAPKKESKNLGSSLKRWQKDPRVVEILATLDAEKGLKEKYTLSDKI